MSGHSKWSQIKRKKGAQDAKRGKVFTKLIKEITVAARIGGGDLDANSRLRTAVAAAKMENMPADNIKRAILKGTGELGGGSQLEELVYEAYGPGGIAVLIESMTDNKNRTSADIRHILSKNNGNLGELGCVSWMFDKKGYITVMRDAVDEDLLMEVALEADAEDIKEGDTEYEIITEPKDFETVKDALHREGISYELAEITMVPQSTVVVGERHAEQVLRLMEQLEDHDDVQKVYSNFDIPEQVMEQITS
jgi:YebC/PmpR family DNA-binding regulatory protein